MRSKHIQVSAEWRVKQRELREKLSLADAEAQNKMNTLMAGLKYQRVKVNKAVEKVTELKGALL